jgi:nucleoid-associated protein YgaU
MEREGELIKITLGEWRRWCVLAETSFKEKSKSDIEYEISFEIISDKPPTNCYQLTDTKEETFQDNADLLAEAADLQANYSGQSDIDQSFADKLTQYVDDVATAVASVNSFVNTLLTQAENIEQGITRAIGLIKVARRNIANMIRRVGALSYAVSGSGGITRQFKSVSSSANAISSASSIMAILAKMQQQFEAIRKTLPKARYKVQSGDTLQRISIKYYGTPNSWDKIYDHNKLTTTALTRGTVLEIPNL